MRLREAIYIYNLQRLLTLHSKRYDTRHAKTMEWFTGFLSPSLPPPPPVPFYGIDERFVYVLTCVAIVLVCIAVVLRLFSDMLSPLVTILKWVICTTTLFVSVCLISESDEFKKISPLVCHAVKLVWSWVATERDKIIAKATDHAEL